MAEAKLMTGIWDLSAPLWGQQLPQISVLFPF